MGNSIYLLRTFLVDRTFLVERRREVFPLATRNERFAVVERRTLDAMNPPTILDEQPEGIYITNWK
jgi:hypothetical protein